MTLRNQCAANIGSALVPALESYRANEHRYPHHLSELSAKYLPQLPTCPKSDLQYHYVATADRYTLFCSGRYHGDAGLGADRPLFDSRDGHH